MTTVQLTVNGEAHRLDIDLRRSLLDLLRETLDLTGTKKGCNQGACGACTILVNGQRILSCLTLAAMHDGAEIVTIEGLAKVEEIHPLQAAFVKHDGFQSGYGPGGGGLIANAGRGAQFDDLRIRLLLLPRLADNIDVNLLGLRATPS
jgi:xanthine dehydrogenase YagT iron-sulfur-binding subunit